MKLVRVVRDSRNAARDYFIPADDARALFATGDLEQINIGHWVYHDPRGRYVLLGVTPGRRDRVLIGD